MQFNRINLLARREVLYGFTDWLKAVKFNSKSLCSLIPFLGGTAPLSSCLVPGCTVWVLTCGQWDASWQSYSFGYTNFTSKRY